MSFNLSNHLPSNELINQGIWITLFNDIKFKIAYSGQTNLLYRSINLENAKNLDTDFTKNITNASQNKKFKFTKEQTDKLLNLSNDLYIKAIIKDWKNLTKDGQEFPYSEDNCRILLNKYPTLKDEIEPYTNNKDLYFNNSQDSTTIKKK